jgi:diguanylate cyclase (GGDEF)-like protein
MNNNNTKVSSWNIILSLVILLALSLITIIAIIVVNVKAVDEDTRINIESYVSAIIQDKLKNQATLTKDYAYWDATIKNAYLSQDKQWIKNNIGQYLTDTFSVTDVYIIDKNDNPVLALNDGEIDKSNYLTIDQDALKALISKARQSGPVPAPVSGMLMINNAPALVGLSVLTPEYSGPLKSPRPLLIVATRMDHDYLADLAEQYRLNGLSFISGPEDYIVEAKVSLKNPNDVNLGQLVWKPEKPGTMVLEKIRIPLLLLFLIVLVIALAIIKFARRTEDQLRKAYRDLAYNANHDSLTGLANRRLFDELLNQTIQTTKRNNITSAILYIDLDNFKKINDQLGHKIGDKLLVTAAKRIKATLRESDVTARLGGDEFIVLLYNVGTREGIEFAAKKLLNELSQPVDYLADVKVSASIGIAVTPDNGTDSDILISRADSALLESKQQGKNTLNFYSGDEKLKDQNT